MFPQWQVIAAPQIHALGAWLQSLYWFRFSPSPQSALLNRYDCLRALESGRILGGYVDLGSSKTSLIEAEGLIILGCLQLPCLETLVPSLLSSVHELALHCALLGRGSTWGISSPHSL